jgi:hypothetical protein
VDARNALCCWLGPRCPGCPGSWPTHLLYAGIAPACPTAGNKNVIPSVPIYGWTAWTGWTNTRASGVSCVRAELAPRTGRTGTLAGSCSRHDFRASVSAFCAPPYRRPVNGQTVAVVERRGEDRTADEAHAGSLTITRPHRRYPRRTSRSTVTRTPREKGPTRSTRVGGSPASALASGPIPPPSPKNACTAFLRGRQNDVPGRQAAERAS